MQATGSMRTFGRSSVQLAVIAAVAVTGIAIGRWGIPAEDSATIVTSSRSDTVSTTDRLDNLVERKLAQMDAAEARYSTTATVTDEASGAEVLVDQANVAPIQASAVDRKFAQMDAAEARNSTTAAVTDETSGAVVLVDRANVVALDGQHTTAGETDNSAADTIVDQANVVAIGDSRDAQEPGTADGRKDRLEMKFAQMDADEAR
jgi:hypothetical protein